MPQLTNHILPACRYPDDPHDRIWLPWYDAMMAELSTTERVQHIENDLFEAPSAVMQTALTPPNGSGVDFYRNPDPHPNDPSIGDIAIMHFSELQLLDGSDVRQFYVNFNGKKPSYPTAFTPQYLYSGAVYNACPPISTTSPSTPLTTRLCHQLLTPLRCSPSSPPPTLELTCRTHLPPWPSRPSITCRRTGWATHAF